MIKPSEAQERMRILIVDDNNAIHDDFRKILAPVPQSVAELDDLEAEIFGARPRVSARAPAVTLFDVDSAYQGLQAVELVRRAASEGRPYALAFVDGRMPPGLSGIETVPLLWQIDPRLQVVISSAYSDHSFTDIVDTLGHSDGLLVLRKPFDAIEVLQVAHALTRKWALSREVAARIDELELTVRMRTKALEDKNAELELQVAERIRAENELKQLATHDLVTGAPNRVLLHDRAVEALSRARRRNETVALMLLDLDHFKDVNDTYGHPTGDALLRAAAQRLKGCVRLTDVVARLGGDEFAILLDGLAEPEEAAIIAERVLTSFGAPFEVGGQELHAPTSIGIAVFPNDCDNVEDLLKSADLALYEAKEGGRAGFRFYAEGMLASSQEQLKLRERLARAVEHDELCVHYQPLVELESGRITAMEALVRWQHPELGLVPPMKFIPAAEKSGQIVAVGRWVLETACKKLSEWRRAYAPELVLAVNVSGREVQAADFVDFVLGTLEKWKLEPSCLELELTESAAMTDVDQSAEVFRRLAARGVRIAIDDFGAGYSSLMRLKQMPISVLKIDRFFVRDLVSNPRDAAIVRTVVAMAHSLGLTVVVEGIETEEQLAALKNMTWDDPVRATCDRVQGYLLSRPLAADAATALIENLRQQPTLRRTGS